MELDLAVEKTYVYYDGPKCFWGSNGLNDNYLFTCVDEDEDAEIFLASKLPVATLSRLDNNEVDMRDAFNGVLGNELFIMRWADKVTMTPILVKDVDNEWLPDTGTKLNVLPLSPAVE